MKALTIDKDQRVEKKLFGGETLTGTSEADIERGFILANEDSLGADTSLFAGLSAPTEGGFLTRPNGWER